MLKKLAHLIFYGNYFYGLCTVGLSVEASMQQGLPLNSFLYYLLVFTTTVVYYTYAYIGDTTSKRYYNQRSAWYGANKPVIRITQVVFSIITVGCTLYVLWLYRNNLTSIPVYAWLFVLFFPLVAAFYYGIIFSPGFKLNLRSQGWLKPFVIGFVWAGIVTIYPVIFHALEQKTQHIFSWYSMWFFIKNWMYITVLCIMFDIKDYAADHNRQLKTFVVRVGLRKTIFYIIIPLTLTGLLSFSIFAFVLQLPLLRVLINTIPFLLLIAVAYSLHQRKRILYYLAVIDGLMLAKALCGIAGVLITDHLHTV